MTSSDPRPEPSDVPPALFAGDTGLTPERLRELLQAEDAYTPRPADEPGSTG